jgi:PIN domain nuclease of toxin-antitoxin system
MPQQSILYNTSAICPWELAFAARKRHLPSRPDLKGKSPRDWFSDAVFQFAIRVIPVDTAIASEAAEVAVNYGSGDPGDCILIATAHLHGLNLITRDARILAFATENPTYLTAIRC